VLGCCVGMLLLIWDIVLLLSCCVVVLLCCCAGMLCWDDVFDFLMLFCC